MLPSNISEITENSLQTLIENSVQESKTIEYKEKLSLSADREKREFLADVSSFANASGGDLIFGIVENKGIPVELKGLEIEDIDGEKLKMSNSIRDSIEPRLPYINIHPVQLSNGRWVIVVRIGKSWISPHRVIFNSHDKFYTRSPGGKYPMDVSELRIAFNLSDTLSEKIQRFKDNRISRIIANEGPVSIKDGAKIVLHLIPLISFSLGQKYEIENTYKDLEIALWPLYGRYSGKRYNFDGFITFYRDRDDKNSGYTQLYRNDIIEAVDSVMLEKFDGVGSIPSILYEETIIKMVERYLNLLKSLGVETPVLVFLTFLGVKGYVLKIDPFRFRNIEKIDREILIPQEVIFETYEEPPVKILKPIFDSVWNSCGLPRSFNYNENGEWKVK